MDNTQELIERIEFYTEWEESRVADLLKDCKAEIERLSNNLESKREAHRITHLEGKGAVRDAEEAQQKLERLNDTEGLAKALYNCDGFGEWGDLEGGSNVKRAFLSYAKAIQNYVNGESDE